MVASSPYACYRVGMSTDYQYAINLATMIYHDEVAKAQAVYDSAVEDIRLERNSRPYTDRRQGGRPRPYWYLGIKETS